MSGNEILCMCVCMVSLIIVDSINQHSYSIGFMMYLVLYLHTCFITRWEVLVELLYIQ